MNPDTPTDKDKKLKKEKREKRRSKRISSTSQELEFAKVSEQIAEELAAQADENAEAKLAEELGPPLDEHNEVEDIPISSDEIAASLKEIAKGMQEDFKKSVSDARKSGTGLPPQARTLIGKILDTYAPFLIAFTLIYLLGYFGLHFLWAALVVAAFLQVDGNRLERLWRRRFHELEREAILRNREIESDPLKESMVWLNTILEKMWPKVAPWAERLALVKGKEAIEETFRKSKPPVVEKLEITDLRLGRSPVLINYMKHHQTGSADIYKVDVDFQYKGELKVAVSLKLGSSLMNVNLPIVVKDVDIRSKLHLQLDLVKGKLPFVRTVHLGFSDTFVDLSIKPMKAFNLLDLPMLRMWLCGTITDVLSNTEIHHQLIPGEVETDEELEMKRREGLLHRGVSGIGSGVKGVGTGVGKGVSAVGKGVATVGTGVGKGVATVGTGVGKGVVTVGSGVGHGVAAVGTGVGKGVVSVGSGVGKGVTAVGSGVGKGFKSGFNALTGRKKKNDKPLADEPTVGQLVVKLIGAERLIAADSTNTSDPYCHLSCAGQKHKSNVVNANCNPTWDQLFEFDVPHDEEHSLLIKVYDRDNLGRRDFLGQTRIDFSGMADQEEQDLWLPLVNKKGEPMQSGKVHVHLTYLQKADKF